MNSPLNRRTVLKGGLFGVTGMLLNNYVGESGSAASPAASPNQGNIDSMKITKIEAVRFRDGFAPNGRRPNFTWFRVHTDKGLVGIGETYPFRDGEIGMMKHIAPMIIGRDPRDIERIWRDIFQRTAYNGWGGSEMRALSAIDIALWDILGKAAQLPVYRLLGGKAQNKIRAYETCFRYDYDFLTDADKIALDILKRGIKAIKIWPFDGTARQNKGNYISPLEIEKCLEPLKKIRNACGEEMEIAVEFHSHWNLPCALRIAEALEPYKPMWIEDMLLQDNMQTYAALTRETSIPVTVSERLATRFQYRELLEQKAADIVMFDITWCGGISEARKISALADTYYLPVAPHTAGGPGLFFSSLHLSAATTNLFIMESVRRFYLQDYKDYIVDVPQPVEGYFQPPERPGLGMELKPELFDNGDAITINLS